MGTATEMTHAAGEQTQQQWPISVVRAGRKPWREQWRGAGGSVGGQDCWDKTIKKLYKITKTLQEAAFIPEIGSLK